MNPTLCPHCGNQCLGFWSKVSLGLARTVRCQSCGNRVSVALLRSSLHLLAVGLIPIACGLLAMEVADAFGVSLWTTAMISIAVGVGIEFWLYYRFVPLVRRSA